MHDKERSDGIFIFIQKLKHKQTFFQLLPTFSGGALTRDQREPTRDNRHQDFHFISFADSKQNTRLHLNVFIIFYFPETNPWPYTQSVVLVMKEELFTYVTFRPGGSSRDVCGRSSFKALFVAASQKTRGRGLCLRGRGLCEISDDATLGLRKPIFYPGYCCYEPLTARYASPQRNHIIIIIIITTVQSCVR